MRDIEFSILEQLHYSYCGGPPSGYPPGGWTKIPALAANLLVDIPTLAPGIVALKSRGYVRLEAGESSALLGIAKQEQAIGAILSNPATQVMISDSGIAAYRDESSRRDFSGLLGSLAEGQSFECAAVFVDLIGHSKLPHEVSAPLQDGFRRFVGNIAVDLGGGEFDNKGDGVMYLFLASPQVGRAMNFCLEAAGGFPPHSLRFGAADEAHLRAVLDVGRIEWRHNRGTVHADVLDWTYKTEGRVKGLIPGGDRSHIVISNRAFQLLEERYRRGIEPLDVGKERIHYRHR